MDLDKMSYGEKWELRRALSSLMKEYQDRKSQFGEEYLWKKHEDTEVIENALRIIEKLYKR